MKLEKIALSATTVLATFISTISNSQAATIVNQALDLVTPPYPTGEPVFQLCADEGNCQPGVASTFTSSQGTGVNINNNNKATMVLSS